MFQIFSRFDILFIPATTRFPPLVCLKGMHIPKLGQSAISQGMTTVNHNLNYRHGNNELGSQIQAIGTLKDIHDLVAITGQHAPAPPPTAVIGLHIGSHTQVVICLEYTFESTYHVSLGFL